MGIAEAREAPVTTAVLRAGLIALAATLGVAAARAPAGPQGTEIRVLVSTALKPAIAPLATAFEKESMRRVRIIYGPSGALARMVEGYEAADVIVLAGRIDGLAKKELIRAEGRRDVARVRLGIVVRDGAPKPDIGTPDALKRVLLAAKTIAYNDPKAGSTSGGAVVALFEKLGIRNEVEARTVLARSGTNDRVSALVASGEADIGVQQIPEITATAGAVLAGPVPEELQTVTLYSAAIPVKAQQPDAADAFIQFLTSASAAESYKTRGFEPVEQPPPPPPPPAPPPAEPPPG